jgi:hypothetical protein
MDFNDDNNPDDHDGNRTGGTCTAAASIPLLKG